MRWIYILAAISLLVIWLTGCGATPVLTEVKIPVPVECREEMPERPAMPTEQVTEKPTLDQFTKAAMAEIERREGYEGQLRTALEACKAPVK